MNTPRPTQTSKFPTGLFIILVLGLLFILPLMLKQAKPKSIEINYSQMLEKVEGNVVAEVVIQQEQIMLQTKDGKIFSSYGPIPDHLLSKMVEKNIKIKHLPPEPPSLLRELLVSIIPILIFVFLLVWLLGRLQGRQGGGSSTLSFGKSKAKLITGSTGVTFADVAGVDEAKEELEEIVDFLKDPSKFTKLGGKIPKGVLMVGPPGTGKTMLAKAVAGEAGVPFLTLSGSDFVEMFVGVGASRVRDLFDQAEKNAPCIIFIDEIDAVGRRRGAGVGGGHDEREQTLNQLLVQMDGFEDTKGIIMIAATNRVDVLDPALLRPGRFDRQVHVSNPDIKGRSEILNIHAANVPLASDVDLQTIAKSTPGFSGADLQNLVNEAALTAARASADEVTQNHFELAKDKVLMGPARKSMVMSDQEKKTTAYHEVGHALVGWFTEGADPVHKVTIVPRGRALGVTMSLPQEDKYSYSRKQALAMIDLAMGGRAAEEIVFNHFTTGASDDIKKATEIARKMVMEWGMSVLGPLNLTKSSSSQPFYGNDYGKGTTHSEDLSKRIDNTIEQIVRESYDRVKNLLESKKDLLETISKELLEKETLSHKEIRELIDNA